METKKLTLNELINLFVFYDKERLSLEIVRGYAHDYFVVVHLKGKPLIHFTYSQISELSKEEIIDKLDKEIRYYEKFEDLPY